MESLQKVIKQTEQQLEQAIKKSRTADIKECVSLDQEINRLQASLKSLRESERLQELLETNETPTDLLTQAKLRNLEMAGQLCEEQIDSEGNDPRMIAFNRFSCAIAILDLLKQASEFPDIETPPTKELYGNLASFITAKQEKVEKARARLTEQDNSISTIETALKDAMTEGNPEKIIKYSESLEKARKEREYLEPMVRETEQSDTFPPGTISDTWKNICDLYRYEWLLRLEIINTAQEIHHRTCDELITLTNALKELRSEIQRIGRANGSKDEIEKYNQQITIGTSLYSVKQIKRDEYDRLDRYIYSNKEKLL